jgi:hypothetical protein
VTALYYILAMLIVVLILCIAAGVQEWLIYRRSKDKR